MGVMRRLVCVTPNGECYVYKGKNVPVGRVSDVSVIVGDNDPYVSCPDCGIGNVNTNTYGELRCSDCNSGFMR